MIGPVLTNLQWQTRADQGIDASQFAIDWEHQQATCPQGRTSRSWTSVADPRGHLLIRVHFSSTDCGHCPVQSRCIHSTEKYKRRVLTLHPQAQHEALLAARKFQQTATFTQQYHLREGREATISQGVRAFGMRRSRYIGEAKTHLQHVGIAAAINVCRLMDWLDGIGPAPTRISAFQQLFLAV